MAESNVITQSLLALSTSEKVASVCISDGSKTVASIDSDQWLDQFPDSQSVGKSTAIVPMIQAIMQRSGTKAGGFGAIALTNGPGGFTGLRVGIVAARMLCYAWDLPVIVVNALEVAADKLRRSRNLDVGAIVWSITDAQRRQVFASKMEVAEDGTLKVVTPQTLLDRSALIDLLNVGDHATGTGAFSFRDAIESKTEITLPDRETATCDAIGVASLASRRFNAEEFDDLLSFEPIYFRPSAAEEVRLAKSLENKLATGLPNRKAKQ